MKELLLVSLLFITLLSCKDSDENPNSLPEATQSGANTAGALVDGKIWVASQNYNSATYAQVIDDNAVIIIDLKNASDKSRIYFKAAIPNFELNKTYILSENADTSDYNFAMYNDNTNKGYLTQPNSIYIGKLKITKLNPTTPDQMVCGTFELKLIGDTGSEINITSGRFDKKFN